MVAGLAVADNASDGWRCVAPHLRECPGAPVLIVGGLAPSIALYAADAALALGAGSVDVVWQNTALLSAAERIGAHAIEANFDGKRGPYPITVDSTVDPAGLRLAIDSTDLEGVCVSPGYYAGPETGVPLGRMYTRGIRFHAGRCHARTVIPEVAAAVAEGRLHPDVIVSRRAAWRDAAEAHGRAGGETSRRTGRGVAP